MSPPDCSAALAERLARFRARRRRHGSCGIASAMDDVAASIRPPPPAWHRLAFFLGTPPALSSRQWLVLALVSTATLFDQYDRSIFALALPQIQQGLGIGEGE